MNPDGTQQKSLYQFSGSLSGRPNWTPDGTKIIVSVVAFSWDIFVFNIESNNANNLTNDSANNWHHNLSSDGSKIAFSSNRDGNYEIYTMNIDGTGRQRLTDNTFDDFFPVWSPDGSRIAYRMGAQNYVMNTDGTNSQRITNVPRFVNWAPMIWSPDGTNILFIEAEKIEGCSQCDIWLVNVDGTNSQNLTADNLGIDSSPAWSPVPVP